MAAMRSSWNELLMRSRSDTIFLTWEWLLTWVEFLPKSGREIFILAVYRRGELIGLAPWCLNRVRFGFVTIRQVEFLGAREAGSDYLDVFARRGKEHAVSTAVYEFLFGEASSRWDRMFLQDVPSSSFFLLHFTEKLAENGKYVEVEPGAFSPFSAIRETDDGLFAGLSPNRREQFRRHLRLLNGRGVVEHTSATSEKGLGGSAVEDFYRLYRKNRPDTKPGFFEFLKAFVDRCQGKNWVQIDLLKVDGVGVASFFHLCHQRTRLLYLLAVDRDFYPTISVGNVLIGLCLRQAVVEGIETYDFLKGSEAYKFHWATDGKRSLTVTLDQKRWGTALLMLGKSVRNFVKWTVR